MANIPVVNGMTVAEMAAIINTIGIQGDQSELSIVELISTMSTKLNAQQVQALIDASGGGGSGSETRESILLKLGITDISGVNTGDQDLTAIISAIAGKASQTDFNNLQTAYNAYVSSNNTAVATKLATSVFDTFVTAYNAAIALKLDASIYNANKTATDSAIEGKVDKVANSSLVPDSDKQKLSAINPLKSAGLFNGVIPVGKFVAPQRGFSDGTQTGLTYSYWFRPKVTCTSVQFLFPNWSLGNSSGGAAAEAIGLNPISIAVSVYNVSFRPVYFNGQSSYVIPPGGFAKSDPIPYTFVAGTNYNIRIAVNVETVGMKWPIGLVPQTTLNEGTLPANTLGNGTVTAITTGGYGPFGIISKPNVKPSFGNIGLFGDSILDGNSNGGTGINLDQGWGRRWLDLINAPWVKFAVGGDKIINHTTDTLTAYVLAYCTGIDIAITNYGANDLASATDLQAAKDVYLKFWEALNNAGIRVIQSTVLPRTSFGTTQEAIRVQINDWIRTTPAPLWKYIELADIAETARNSGVWKSGLQTDGTHPTAAGEATIAAALPPASFLSI